MSPMEGLGGMGGSSFLCGASKQFPNSGALSAFSKGGWGELWLMD